VSPKRTIVLSAFACDPNLPSEPTVGWDYLRAWADIVADEPALRLVAVMNGRSRAASLTRLRELGLDVQRVELVGIDPPRALRFLLRPGLTRIEYLVWAWRARAFLREEDDVLLARHVTFATEILPTPISALPSSSFRVWGPLGASGQVGAMLAAPRSRGWFRDAALEWLREHIAPVVARRIAATVDLTLAASQPFHDDLQQHGHRAELFQNVRQERALHDLIQEETARAGTTTGRSLQLLAVGHLIPRKRFELAVSALTDHRLREARLTIIGTAPASLTARLTTLAEELGVADRVSFVGQIPRRDVVAAMVQADVLLHPAAREGAPGVVGEATSVGLPVVVFEGTGSSAVLDAAGVPGVKMDPKRWRSRRLVADAVVEATQLPRVRSTVWGAERYEVKERILLEEAQRRTTRDT
jgi:glycosyltransferase involved in cell wall biosynthesis